MNTADEMPKQHTMWFAARYRLHHPWGVLVRATLTTFAREDTNTMFRFRLKCLAFSLSANRLVTPESPSND